MTDDRIDAVADAMIALGSDGIVQFDTTEPEYEFITATVDIVESDAHLALLSILAATQDYYLSGDAQLFWRTLERIVLDRDDISTETDVNATLNEFMDEPVNARSRSQKKDRLVRMANNGFGEWFLDNYPNVVPLAVWDKIAAALETKKDKKTVVIAMKVYDIYNLVDNGEYLELPVDLPIPCDLQVERVAIGSGIIEPNERSQVMDAWAAVLERVNMGLEQPVSMLRIDSIVWQAGQIISDHRDRREPSRRALESYFVDHVGLDAMDGERLANELTAALQ